jgi:hypothetical protein
MLPASWLLIRELGPTEPQCGGCGQRLLRITAASCVLSGNDEIDHRLHQGFTALADPRGLHRPDYTTNNNAFQ